MNVLEAHELIAHAYYHDSESIRAWLPEDVELSEGVDFTVAALVAAATISGELDDCESLADLQSAVEHFSGLLSSGIVTIEDWTNETQQVVCDLLEWGDRISEENARRAELN